MHQPYKIKKSGFVSLICLLLISILILGSIGYIWAGLSSEKSVWSGRHRLDYNIQSKLNLVQINQKLFNAVQSKVQTVRQHELFQEKIKDYPVHEKIRMYVQSARSAKDTGIPNNLNKLPASADQLQPGTGSISGTVLVEGEVPYDYIEILVFDSYGFHKGSGYAGYDSGTYMVGNLPAGDYYVVTESPFVDEFYPNIFCNDFKSWRSASLVTVAENQNTGDINFDLVEGAKVSGYILDAGGTNPLTYMGVNFEIYKTDNPEDSDYAWAYTDLTGYYEINIAATGDFKIQASSYGYQPEFYNQKSDWLSADAITISTFDDSIPNISFTLTESIPGGSFSATISGHLTGPGEMPVNQALVFAFNTADTSIAGIAISGMDSSMGEYTIYGLSPGTYILYADQYMEVAAPPAVIGEYYQDAATPDLATLVQISEPGEMITDIDFTMDVGGGISGNISNANQQALEEIIVIAIKADLNFTDKFFMDEIEFSLGVSDVNGDYAIEGLASGEYIVRTFSLIGTHAGAFIDEYYQDVTGIFDYNQASKVSVTVPVTSSGIDFSLDFASAISGHFYASDGISPVLGIGAVIALNSQTEMPELAIPQYNYQDGSYLIGPLPAGDYKLLAFVISDEGAAPPIEFENTQRSLTKLNALQQYPDPVFYVPQFYNGKRTVTEADPVTVTAADTTPDINFNMVKAGAVQGVVNYLPNTPIGADTLYEIMVTAFEAVSGEAITASTTTFAGGYRLDGLPPGQYKIAAMPAADGYATTYYGGGTTFDDVNSTNVTVMEDDTSFADITLTQGSGSISGMVYNETGSTHLDRILVLVYDQTGHAVSGGISGYDLNMRPTEPGRYHALGLRPGQYYVRTFALLDLFELFGEDVVVAESQPMLTKQQQLEPGAIHIYQDMWYEDTPVQFHMDPLVLLGILLTAGDLDDGPPYLPFSSPIDNGADLVAVGQDSETPGINFYLPEIDLFGLAGEIVNVESQNNLPGAFDLQQNYPNPFNPETKIQFSLAQQSRIRITVYNALGQRIQVLLDARKPAGNHEVTFHAVDLPSGIYFYQLEAGEFKSTRKMVLLK